ncbi:MAG: hypothetical protein RLY66_340 [Candidatus Parcubacteria bacterium]|jgi:murein DD-endopeptidase MepM/ murein hydrolase activator NlpD
MKIKNYLQLLTVALMGLLSIQNSSAVEEQFTIYDLDSTQDKWYGTVYNKDGKNNDILRVGGWGDAYHTLIKLPSYVTVPPRIFITRARLYLYSYGSTKPTPMRKYFVLNNWTETSTTDHNSLSLATVNGVNNELLAPPENGEYVIDITGEFSLWISGDYGNHGIRLSPLDTNNKFNHFLSSENTRGFGKPRIVVDYERLPDFKLPLPGNKRWRLHVEAGGKEFDHQTHIDPFHTGKTYYSLDFGPQWAPLVGGTLTTATDVPIYAAAGGKVVDVALNANNPNGWFVKIDHDGDGKLTTGFQTVYIHLKNQPLVSKNSFVRQGDKLGIMGTTGVDSNGDPTSTGIHLHMTFYYKNDGGLDIMNYDSPYLNTLRMEGTSIKNFKLGTTWNSGSSLWTPIVVSPSSNNTGM